LKQEKIVRDPIRDYLESTRSSLTELERFDLTSLNPNSEEAKAKFRLFLIDAKENPYSMCICASCYRSGWGVEINHQQVFQFAMAAASKKFAPGLFELGYCYELGIGITQDLKKGRDLEDEAAQNGYAVAANHLAIQYYNSQSNENSAQLALKYAEIGFQIGDSFSASLIASWYEEGGKLPKDLDVARQWYETAARMGSQSACSRLAFAFLNGDLENPVDKDKATYYLNLAKSSTSF
jgi:uncharacterized protein